MYPKILEVTLGPLWFGFYINDLPNAVLENCVLFADDAAFIINSSDLTDLFRRIQQLFNDIVRYLEYNCLVANGMKNKLMMFSSHVVAELPDFVFSGQTVEWAAQYKYLGLVLANKLSYGKHINKVALNISRISGMLTNIRDILPQCILLKLYQALALPHISLHLEIWGSALIYLLNTLKKKMNNLLRMIFGIYRVNGSLYLTWEHVKCITLIAF